MSSFNGSRTLASAETRQTTNPPNNFPAVMNFRPTEYYSQPIQIRPEVAQMTPSSTHATAPTTTTPATAESPSYGGLPQYPASNLSPSTVTSFRNGGTSNLESTWTSNQQNIVVESPQDGRHQSEDGHKYSKRHKFSTRVIRGADEMVAVIKLLEEMDRRSQQRYDKAINMYHEMSQEFNGLETKFECRSSELDKRIPSFEQLSERLGECIAGSKRIQEHHDHILWLGSRIKTSDDRYEQLNSRIAAIENGLSNLSQRMVQIEADRTQYITRETINALELAHAQAAESRLRIFGGNIQSEILSQKQDINSLTNEMQQTNARTTALEASSSNSASENLNSRLSKTEHQVDMIPSQPQRSSNEASETSSQIVALGTKVTALQDDLIIINRTFSRQRQHQQDVRSITQELEKSKATVSQLQARYKKLRTWLESSKDKFERNGSIEELCKDIRQFDPSVQTQGDSQVEAVLSAVFENPRVVTSSPCQSLKVVDPGSAANRLRENDQMPRVSVEAEKSRTLAVQDVAVGQAQNHDQQGSQDRDLGCMEVFTPHLEKTSSRERPSSKRSMTADDLGSEDEITVKRVKPSD